VSQTESSVLRGRPVVFDQCVQQSNTNTRTEIDGCEQSRTVDRNWVGDQNGSFPLTGCARTRLRLVSASEKVFYLLLSRIADTSVNQPMKECNTS